MRTTKQFGFALLAVCAAMVGSAADKPDFGFWVELHDIPGKNCVCVSHRKYDKHYVMTRLGAIEGGNGTSVAIPVYGLEHELKDSDVFAFAGTYSAFGTPKVWSEEKMWETYGCHFKNAYETGGMIERVWRDMDVGWVDDLVNDHLPTVLERDENGRTKELLCYTNGEHSDFHYSLMSGIWDVQDPITEQISLKPVEGRQWIVVPTPKSAKGPITSFYVGVVVDGKTYVHSVSGIDGATIRGKGAWGCSLGDYMEEKNLGELIAVPVGNALGKATGSGVYVKGKKVTVKATATKGNVFVGWYADADAAAEGGLREASAVPISRLANLSFSMPTNDVTLYAKFIPPSEDWASVECEVADEYVTKQAIKPITVKANGGSLPTVKVTGLPAGLKFATKLVTTKVTQGAGRERTTVLVTNALPNQIYGAPTKSGRYATTVTVTTAGKMTAVTNLTFVVLDRSAGERILETNVDTTMGRVTGGGIYKSGAKVSLKATANAAKKATKTTPAQEATVFAGWYADQEFTEPLVGSSDYRSTSFAYTMPDEDAVVHARFVSAVEDTEITLKIDDALVKDRAEDTVFNTSGELRLTLNVNSISLPKITVSGLPAGIKVTDKQVLNKDKSVAAEANTIYGTATKPGTYVVTEKLTNTTVKRAIEKKFQIVVDNLTGANDCFRHELANARDEKYVISAGVSEFDLPSLQLRVDDTLRVTGLPPGLKYNASAAILEGRATKAGTYTVYLTVGKKVSTFTLVVEPLPDWLVGTYECYVYDRDGDSTKATLTIDAKGNLTAKAYQAYRTKISTGGIKGALNRKVDETFVSISTRIDLDDGMLETRTFVFSRRMIDGVPVGVVGYREKEENPADANDLGFGVKSVWKNHAGTALAPNIAQGCQLDVPMDGWVESHVYDEETGHWVKATDTDCYQNGCSLLLKFGLNGAVTVKYCRGNQTLATCSAQLAPYEYDEETQKLKAFLSPMIAYTGCSHAIGCTLFLELDLSNGTVDRDDIQVIDYLLEDR